MTLTSKAEYNDRQEIMQIPIEPAEKPTYKLRERKNPEEIQRQARTISQLPILDIMSRHSPDFIGVLNSSRQFVYVNRKAFPESEGSSSIIGLRPGEVLGCVHSNETEFGCGLSGACAYCDVMKAVMATLTTEEAVKREGRILIEKQGVHDSLDVRIYTSYITQENEEFVILHIQDISAEKRMDIMERIFYHDIYNTIASLHSIINLSQITSDDIPDVERYLLSGVNDIEEQIEYQRLMKAIEQGRTVEAPPLSEIQEITEEFLPLINNPAFLEGRIFRSEIHLEPVYIKAKPVILRRILMNLLKNAKEASKPGDTLSLEVSTTDKDSFFRVRNPQYISPDIQAGIFQHSFSTKGLGRGYGTYSMKILSQRYLGGDIDFNTSKKEGTCFTLRIPLGQA